MVLWYFWIYSFLGYLLEKLFAKVTHAEKQCRKCFLLLPMCPVYGLGMLAVLALTIVGAEDILTPVNILLYDLIWLVPALLVTEWTRSV